jgi:hypothetical protein
MQGLPPAKRAITDFRHYHYHSKTKPIPRTAAVAVYSAACSRPMAFRTRDRSDGVSAPGVRANALAICSASLKRRSRA